jgi:hypothetical protein
MRENSRRRKVRPLTPANPEGVSINSSVVLPEAAAIPGASSTAEVKTRKRKSTARKSEGAAATMERALYQKLRNEVDEFKFDTLISGVSTLSQPGVIGNQKEVSSLPIPYTAGTTDELVARIPGVPESSPYSGIAGFSGRLSLAPPSNDPPLMVGAGPLESHQAHNEHLTSRPKTGIAYVTVATGNSRNGNGRSSRVWLLTIVMAFVLLAASTLYLYWFKPDLFESVQAGLPVRIGSNASKLWLKKGLPDPRITPGDRDVNGIRPKPISAESKAAAFQAYGIDPQDKRFRVARLIPASLSGTNNPGNLFPVTVWYWNLKAKVDKAISDKVHSGTITAIQAEEQIKSNWVESIRQPYLQSFHFDVSFASRKTLIDLK